MLERDMWICPTLMFNSKYITPNHTSFNPFFVNILHSETFGNRTERNLTNGFFLYILILNYLKPIA